MIRRISIAVLFLQATAVFAQENSTNGWFLPTQDTLRVLMVFVEIEYDTLPELNVLPEGRMEWEVGELPGYADTIFDIFALEEPVAAMSKYYKEVSLGNFVVLGDYLPDLYRIKKSDLLKPGAYSLLRELSDQLKNDSTLRSNSGLEMTDFDLWKDPKQTGMPKERRDGEFEGVDHVMIFTRNFEGLPRDNGMASGGSMGFINGYRSNTYSIFAGGYNFPFDVLRHEVNHLLIGGNNFHCGGGNSPRFKSYFPFVQGGWCMMGGANSSFLTCSGWDRYWLGWNRPGNEFLISARTKEGREINGDIKREDGSGIYVLRDFATDGDALRIKLPFIPDSEFQQWLWVENHLTKPFNGSDFDVIQYEHYDCIGASKPGLYMYVQADADTREGKNIHSKVNADYLRPVLADGNYDFKWEDYFLKLEPCVNDLAYIPYFYEADFENALTGNHAQEFPQYYTNAEVKLTAETARKPLTRRIGGVYERIALMGNARQGFREGGNNRLGVGTNPSTSNMLTLVNSRKPAPTNSENNRKIYINGLHIEILETLPDMSLVVEVRFDDNIIDQNRRWCAPEIVLNNHISDGPDLIVKGNLKLDIGETMTRFDNPDTVNGKTYFTDPTHLIVKQGAELLVEGSVTLTANSKLIIEKGGVLTISKKSRIYVENGSELILNEGAKIEGDGKVKIKKTGVIMNAERANNEIMRKLARPSKRVRNSP